MIAALYVETGGVYYGLPDVDPWDQERDARDYPGPHPVVAHPPCKRWGRWWYADGSSEPGQDGGLFAHALDAVCQYGGALEHPAHSHAWRKFDIPTPAPGQWTRSLLRPDLWTTEVHQRNYGHRALKLTWLVYVGSNPPNLDWGPPKPPAAYLCAPGRTATKPGRTDVEIMGPKEARSTPIPFRDLLLDMARSVNAEAA